MREIILDTETTGLDPANGHRLVEVAAVELVNRVPTGEFYHVYLNPQRSMPEEAFRVHGLSEEFLKDKPLFAAVANDFLAFIADSPLVIHNAEFDMKFLNHELSLANIPRLPSERAVDSLALARRKHPGVSNSLDALCVRYRIDASKRVKHGALLDAQILAEVYGELMGGRQAAMALHHAEKATAPQQIPQTSESRFRPFVSLLSRGEAQAHAGLRESLGNSAIWNEYMRNRES